MKNERFDEQQPAYLFQEGGYRHCPRDSGDQSISKKDILMKSALAET